MPVAYRTRRRHLLVGDQLGAPTRSPSSFRSTSSDAAENSPGGLRAGVLPQQVIDELLHRHGCSAISAPRCSSPSAR
jgi:hypothetical protein